MFFCEWLGKFLFTCVLSRINFCEICQYGCGYKGLCPLALLKFLKVFISVAV